MDQEPQMLAAKSQRISERGGTKGGGGGGTADGYGSEAEQQMDKNAGWDEGTCAQCGACYVRSIIRPVLCQCGAELCGYSFRCLFAHAKRCAAATNAQAAYE